MTSTAGGESVLNYSRDPLKDRCHTHTHAHTLQQLLPDSNQHRLCVCAASHTATSSAGVLSAVTKRERRSETPRENTTDVDLKKNVLWKGAKA